MTPQEEQLLNSLVERVSQTQLQQKDPDAEAMLNSKLGRNPDALYVLAQTVLVQNIALEQAKAQVAQLQQEAQQAHQQPAHATSFLGSLLGLREPAPVPPPPAPPQAGFPPAAPPYQPVQYAQPQYPQTQYAPAPVAPVASGQPSFLSGAMQTAAGVAAGALAFEGVEAVVHGLGGLGHSGLGMGGFGIGPGMGMQGGFGRPMEETVINNYYEEPGRGEHGGEQRFHESADQGGAQFNDASYNTQGDDRGSYDQGGLDDSSDLDNSGTDDGGGFDSGGSDGGGDLL